MTPIDGENISILILITGLKKKNSKQNVDHRIFWSNFIYQQHVFRKSMIFGKTIRGTETMRRQKDNRRPCIK